MRRYIGLTIVALAVTATALSAQASGEQRRQGPTTDRAATMDHGQMDHGEMQQGPSDGGAMEGHGGSGDGGMMGGMMERMRMMHGGGEGGGMGSMGSGGAATDPGGPGPARLLGMVEELDLSADQIGRLGEIRERLAITRREHRQAMESAHQAAQEALESTPPDFSAYEEALREQADHRIRMQVAAARAGSESRNVLTPDQLEQLPDRTDGGMGGGMGGNATGSEGMSHSH